MRNNGIVSAVFIVFVLTLLGSSLFAATTKQQSTNVPQQQVTVPSPVPTSESTTFSSPTPTPPHIQRGFFREHEGRDDD